jgi:enamine deaminase RidA (YjgF/YER057c/UK114 family)
LSDDNPSIEDDPNIERLGGDPPSPFEAMFGFNRVVTAGPWVLVSGTTSVDPSGFVVGTTPHEQTAEILNKLIHELARVGLCADNVVLTRIYVTDISRADEVGRAHGEAFGAVGPAATMVEVSGLIDPRMLVEIELMAYRG